MNTGIILQSHAAVSQRLIIFDKMKGKIIAYVRSTERPKSTPQGAMVEYTYSVWRDMIFLEAIELTSLSLPSGIHSLQFMHQIFEILLAFMPLQQPSTELFSCLLLLYDERQKHSASILRQRIFLCYILAQLGIYPSESRYLSEHRVRRLILSPFEFMVDDEDVNTHQAIGTWLQECLASHPYIRSWKTLK
jgi:recombinational DNA repair protein (RecF pathway)